MKVASILRADLLKRLLPGTGGGAERTRTANSAKQPYSYAQYKSLIRRWRRARGRRPASIGSVACASSPRST